MANSFFKAYFPEGIFRYFTFRQKISGLMKITTLSFVVFAFIGTGLLAQNPATVTFRLNHPMGLDSGSVAVFEVKIEPHKGWHVYSAEPSEEGVYKPTAIEYDLSSRGFAADEKISESGLLMKEYDDIMEGTMRYYKSPVTFTQKIKITEAEVFLKGTVDYMACDNEKCLVFTEEFEVKPEE